MNLLAFLVGEELYATPIENVNRIIEWIEPSKIGSNHDSVIGVIKESDSIVTLISLNKILNQESYDETKQIVLVNLEGYQKLGFVTNGNAHTLNIDDDEIGEISTVLKQADYIKGLIESQNRIVGLLDLEEIFNAVFRN